jgi:hypothetical protein
VEIDLRRLLGQTAKSADRSGGDLRTENNLAADQLIIKIRVHLRRSAAKLKFCPERQSIPGELQVLLIEWKITKKTADGFSDLKKSA